MDQVKKQIDKRPEEQSLTFAITAVISIIILWSILNRGVLSLHGDFYFTGAQLMIIDGIIRGVFAILAMIVLGKIIQSNGFKFSFTTLGFKKGVFAHAPLLLLLLAAPFIVLSMLDASLTFTNVMTWLGPMAVFDIGNAVWEEVLWRGVLMTGMLIFWSSTWEDKPTVRKRVLLMLICSLAFGLIHFNGGLLHIASATVMGTIFSAAYIYSKNLLACSIVHALINYILRAIFFMFDDLELGIMLFTRFLIVNTVLGIIAVPFAILLTIKAEPFWPEAEVLQEYNQ